MLTSSLFIQLRSMTRTLGINRAIGRLMQGKQYEDRFAVAFRARVRPGDTVWDVGANLGLYTREFMQLVGADGTVVAFEPTPACFAKLKEQFAATPTVRLMNMALGNASGTIRMAIAEDPLAATHHVISSAEASAGQDVQVRTAADVVKEAPDLFPTVVKCDVEGHEGAVMDGLESLLPDRRLRVIGIEVHFGLLANRGEAHRPRQIENLLLQHGFQVAWTDASHILATR